MVPIRRRKLNKKRLREVRQEEESHKEMVKESRIFNSVLLRKN